VRVFALLLSQGILSNSVSIQSKISFGSSPDFLLRPISSRRVLRSQLTELANTDFESWAKESYEIAAKIAYRNDGRIGIPKGGNMDCAMVLAASVLPAGYVLNASRIADRRMILVGYRLGDLLKRLLRSESQKKLTSKSN
jgi:hypothetical protein